MADDKIKVRGERIVKTRYWRVEVSSGHYGDAHIESPTAEEAKNVVGIDNIEWEDPGDFEIEDVVEVDEDGEEI